MNNRECKDCKITQHIDKFEMSDKVRKIRRRVCKTCRVLKRKEYMKQYWINNKTDVIITKRICLNCNVEKEICKFQNASNINNKSKSWSKYCNPCKVSRRKEYMKHYHKKKYNSKKKAKLLNAPSI